MSYFGIQIQTSINFTKEVVEKLTYKGHPFVQWLSRWIPFDPDVHVTVSRIVPDMGYIMVGNKMICHPAGYDALKKAMKSKGFEHE